MSDVQVFDFGRRFITLARWKRGSNVLGMKFNKSWLVAALVSISCVMSPAQAATKKAAKPAAVSAKKSAAKPAVRKSAKGSKVAKPGVQRTGATSIVAPAVAPGFVAAAAAAAPRQPQAAMVAASGASGSSFGQLYGLHHTQDPLDLKSSVALVVDQETNEVLFAKNQDAVLPIASLTKLMTAMEIGRAHV